MEIAGGLAAVALTIIALSALGGAKIVPNATSWAWSLVNRSAVRN
jgi:hypothetical protein